MQNIISPAHVRDARGGVARVHVDALELDAAERWVYYAPPFGPRYRVPAELLRDPQIDDVELARSVETVFEMTPIASLLLDQTGNFYLGDVAQHAIVQRTPDGTTTQLIADPRIQWPDAGSISSDGYFYLPASQVNRIAPFNGGTSAVEPPFAIYRFQLPHNIRQSLGKSAWVTKTPGASPPPGWKPVLTLDAARSAIAAAKAKARELD